MLFKHLSNCALTDVYGTGQDILAGEKPKEEYYKDSAQFLNAGEKAALDSGEGAGGSLAFLTRGAFLLQLCSRYQLKILSLIGIQQLATRSMDDALRSFDGVLAEKPTNLVALLGKVHSYFLPFPLPLVILTLPYR